MPVTRSAWPPITRSVSSVATLYIFTKSPEAHSRYLGEEEEEESRYPAARGRGGPSTPGERQVAMHQPAAAPAAELRSSLHGWEARPPAPLAWNRRRRRPWHRGGCCRRIAPRGASPAPPSSLSTTPDLSPLPRRARPLSSRPPPRLYGARPPR